MITLIFHFTSDEQATSSSASANTEVVSNINVASDVSNNPKGLEWPD